MAWTIDEALNDELLHDIERNDGVGDYSFRVGALQTRVWVEVRRLATSDTASYRRSHDIKTPSQIGPYHQSRPYWDDVPYALHQAVSSVTEYYRQGVKDGHTPAESWLVEN